MSRFGVYGSGPVRMKINGSRLVTWSEENVVKSFKNGIDKSENSVDILGKSEVIGPFGPLKVENLNRRPNFYSS